jgi:hypothetical protein
MCSEFISSMGTCPYFERSSNEQHSNGQGVIRASRRRIHGPGKKNPIFTQPSLGTFIDAFDVKCECGMNESQHDEGCIEQGAHAIFNFT